MPERKWFKRRLYGWGWEPVTWEGWLTVGIWFALVLFFASSVDDGTEPHRLMLTFIMPILFLTLALIRICYLKGDSPRWQWGKDLGDPGKL